jgi:hypothetical protein
VKFQLPHKNCMEHFPRNKEGASKLKFAPMIYSHLPKSSTDPSYMLYRRQPGCFILVLVLSQNLGGFILCGFYCLSNKVPSFTIWMFTDVHSCTSCSFLHVVVHGFILNIFCAACKIMKHSA